MQNTEANAATNRPQVNVKQILEQISSIPPLPATTIKLSHILADPDSAIKDIAEVIQYDQAITANLLRLCNSAYFGFAEPVSSVKEAIVRLGTSKVFQLAMASSSRALLSRKVGGYALDEGQLWRHSVGAAVSAQAICEHFGLGIVGVTFTAALIHDVGKLLLDQYVGAEYEQLIELSEQDGFDFNLAEEKLIGIGHAELGAQLGENWGMPPVMVDCIRYHHTPQEAPSENEAVKVVYLADMMAMSLGFGLGSDGLRYRADAAICETLALDRTEFDQLCAKILLECAQVEKLFSSA
jgi:putative nucleotidyltransferase with HDIG domain